MTETVELFTAEDFKQIKAEEAPQAERLAHILTEMFFAGQDGTKIVLDVGCATGLYLASFEERGIGGIGFEPARDEAEKAGLDISKEWIYDKPYDSPERGFHLTLCLEVAEHLPPEESETFIKNLCSSSDIIVFSAAQPGQGGKGHINCQSKEYWVELFQNNNFYVDSFDTAAVLDYMQQGPHMGWLINNLMVLKRRSNTDFVTYADKKRGDLNSEEKMNTDPNTGGMKASKPSQIGFIDPQALMTLGEVAGMGAEKYDKFNYLKGFDWSLCYNAMMRHAQAFWNGEDLDPESGLPHISHAAWQALALLSFYQRNLGTDDRPGTVMGFNQPEGDNK